MKMKSEKLRTFLIIAIIIISAAVLGWIGGRLFLDRVC